MGVKFVNDADLTTVADAIRTKGGTTSQLVFPSGMAAAIEAIPSGAALPVLTRPAVESVVLAGFEYINGAGVKKTGTLPELSETELAVKHENGMLYIDPSEDGFVTGETHGEVSAASLDANLIAGNIKKDVSVFGVTGTFEGTNLLAYCTTMASVFYGAAIPFETLTINAPNAKSFASAFSCMQSCGFRYLIINTDRITNMVEFSRNRYTSENQLYSVKINADSIRSSSWKDAFAQQRNLRTLDFQIDFTGATIVSGIFDWCVSLVEVRFVPSSLNVSLSIVNSPLLSAESLISVANGLDETATGKTLTLHATAKAACDTVMGTVTGGVFAADASGTTSLTAFITLTKGWTMP